MRTRRSRPAPVPRPAFAGFCFPPEVIVLAVRWYLRFSLSGTVASGPKVRLAGSNVEPLPVQMAARSAQSSQSLPSPMAFRDSGGGRRFEWSPDATVPSERSPSQGQQWCRAVRRAAS
jgi:hypothetical protein